jgi:hypothetical protein
MVSSEMVVRVPKPVCGLSRALRVGRAMPMVSRGGEGA